MEERLGPYVILKTLAHGGMGEVLLARREGPSGFSRKIVIKRILKHLASDPHYVEMFLNEARLAARLDHPNIVTVVELGEASGSYFLAMEYLHGRTLRDVRKALRDRTERLTPRLAAFISSQVLRGLHHAHSTLGILHRDLSPDNVMLGFSGFVKVLDFGIAKAADSGPRTQSGTFKGKYEYVSPEVLRGEPLDGRSDLYSLGVTLYEVLVGERPLREQPLKRSLASLTDVAPPALIDILARSLADSPQDRFETAEKMAEALDEYLALSSEAAGAPQLCALMNRLFDATEQPGESPAQSPVRQTESLAARSSPVAAEAPTQTANGGSQARPRGTKRRWRTMVAVGAATLAVLGGGVAFLSVHPAPVLAPNSTGVPTDPSPIGALQRDSGTEAEAVASEVPTERAPARRAMGRLIVRVNPWAEVFVNGKARGVTPLAQPIEVPAGRVTVVLKNSVLKVVRKRTVKVPANGEAMLLEDLNPP